MKNIYLLNLSIKLVRLSTVCRLFNLTIVIITLLMITGCQQTQNPSSVVSNDNKGSVSNDRASQTIEFVSMIDLIAAPSKYNGKRIRVTGVLSVEFEDNALYFHKDDYTFGVPENAFWLELHDPINDDWKSLQSKYVLVIGTFSTEHQNIFRGEIKNIEAIKPSRNRDEVRHTN